MTQLIRLTEWHLNIHKLEINLRAKAHFDLENENAGLITGESAMCHVSWRSVSMSQLLHVCH
jgi:hypothetical protein